MEKFEKDCEKEFRKNLRNKLKDYLKYNNNDFMLTYRQICLDIELMDLSSYNKNFYRMYCHNYLLKLNDKLGV